MTLEEFAAYAEGFAREHGEPGTLSLRHLQRLVAGKGPKGQPLGPIRPATARLLERIFETDSSDLLSSPMQAVAPPDDDAAELRERIQKAKRVDAGMLQSLRGQLNSIRRTDRQFGAIVTHTEVLARISQVRDLFTYSLTVTTRRELAILLSEMHTLAGWQALDTGHRSVSWRHYEEAKQAALETEEISYHVHATAEQAFTLIDLNYTTTAVHLLESTLRAAERRCPQLLRAWLVAAHGETLAADRQPDQSRKQFDEAEHQLPRESVPKEGPYIVLDRNHLTRWRGHSVSQSDRVGSFSLLTNALKGLDPTFIRAESALRVDLASALIALHEIDKASGQLDKASKMAYNLGSIRQLRRISALRTV
ncbi:hypothetical protein [Saccharopolyspora sp. SCSIO 74807]|uniref:hypothetical protein n=1 Tax=Saccharopolyspora sp. SCSIO 74807 TaxID=3118084 RepID=UPI0030CEC178